MRDVIVKTKLKIIEYHDTSYQELRQTCCLGLDFITMSRPVYMYASTPRTNLMSMCASTFIAQ